MKAYIALVCIVLMAGAAKADVVADSTRPDIITPSDVTSLSMSGNGRFISTGLVDPGSYPLNPSEKTWSIYEILPQHFDERQWGSADEDAGCTGIVPAGADEDCTTDVVDVAVSHDGQRVLIGAVASSSSSWILLASPQTGQTASVELPMELVDLDISDDGRNGFAVGIVDGDTLLPGGTGYHLAMDASNSKIQATEVSLGSTPDAVDVTADGVFGLVNEGNRIEVFRGSNFVYSNSLSSIEAAEISDRTPYRAVAATALGQVRIYEALDPTEAFLKLNVPPTGAKLTDIAVSPAGDTLVMSHADGALELLRIVADPVRLESVTFVDANQLIDEIRFSADGKLLLAVGQQWVGQFDTKGLQKLWETDLGVNITDTAMDGTGDRVAVAFGNTVRVFEAKHHLHIDAAASVDLIPAQATAVRFEITNDGNRVERFTWTVDADRPWVSGPQQGELILAPGESSPVFISVETPAATSPQEFELVFLTSTGADKKVSAVVPEVRAFSWNAPTGEIEFPAKAGVPVTWTGQLTNVGNVVATPSLTLTKSAPGWNGAVIESPSSLEPGEQGTVEVTVTAPESAAYLEGGVFTVKEGQAALTLRGTVGAKFGLGLQASLSTNLDLDENNVILAKVTNTGNVEEDVAISLEDIPAGWTMTLNGEEEARLAGMAPGESRTVRIAVQVGEDSALSGFVTVTAKSLPHPSIDAVRIMGIHVSGGDDDRVIPMPWIPVALLVAVLAWSRRRT